MSHFRNLVNSFNTFGSNQIAHVRRRSLSRGVSLDDNRRSAPQAPSSQTLQRSSATTPASSVTTPTSGLGTGTSGGSGSVRKVPSVSSTKVVATVSASRSSNGQSVEDEEREARRQRRLRRRSDCNAMFPQTKTDAVCHASAHLVRGSRFQSLSPQRVAPVQHKPALLNDASLNGNDYYVESRMMNNGMAVDPSTSPSFDDRKTSLSCRYAGLTGRKLKRLFSLDGNATSS